jgi:hypothetical protein
VLELIIEHDNNIAWKKEQYVGRIKYSPLQPSVGKTIPFHLLSDAYQIRIDSEGRCFITSLGTSLPTGDPLVLMLQVFYKKGA